MICSISMPSDTLARRTQRLLRARGFPSELVRTTGKEGCGVGLRVTGSCDRIRDILQQEGIDVRGLKSERGGG